MKRGQRKLCDVPNGPAKAMSAVVEAYLRRELIDFEAAEYAGFVRYYVANTEVQRAKTGLARCFHEMREGGSK